MKKPTKYPRYQDYVIRNGKLIGEFEDMYNDFDDPWEQSSLEPGALDKTIGLLLLKRHGHQRVVEYGCGLGHFTAQLHRELGAAAGVDISFTAIDKARTRFPDATFFVGDITDDTPINKFGPDALVFAEITWYVLESLPDFKKLMTDKCGGRGFLHILTVYPKEKQLYGKDHFTNLDEILTYWSDTVDINDWGMIANKEVAGGARTYFYGKIRRLSRS